MSRKLRDDKTCLNCGHPVPDRYCSHCGQENIETRQTVFALVLHFLEDLTHYEGKFWSTLRYLFFKPGYLTKKYLDGKRKSYLAPIRLYIFSSFITFFLLAVTSAPDLGLDAHESDTRVDSTQADSAIQARGSLYYSSSSGLHLNSDYKRISQLDSAYEGYILPLDTDELDIVKYWWNRKALEFKNYTPPQLWKLFITTLGRNIPKSLILFMPVFAWVIWLFHFGRNRAYFDHAIHTLHYFSFLLLFYLVNILILRGISWIEIHTAAYAAALVMQIQGVLMAGYTIYYFYRSHKVLYEESGAVSFIKASAILTINGILFVLVFVSVLLITILTLH